jgi:hypothetical protein
MQNKTTIYANGIMPFFSFWAAIREHNIRTELLKKVFIIDSVIVFEISAYSNI